MMRALQMVLGNAKKVIGIGKNLPYSQRGLQSSAAASQKLEISGMFTPLGTPFNADESVAYDKLEENLSKLNSTDLRGYLVEGSNGEFIFLTPEERVEVVARARKAIPKKLLLAGAGAESTTATINFCEKMAAAGADAVMIVTPAYFKASVNDRFFIHHYEAVADKCPIPVLLYSVPQNTGVDLSVAAVKVLSQHPNIIGMKDSGGDITKLASLVSATKDNDFKVMAGSAGYLLGALYVGCAGGVCALGNVLPSQLCQIYSMYHEGAPKQDLLSLHYSLIAPNTAVTKQFGVPGMKLAMEWMGLYGGPCRKPLLPLLPNEVESLKGIMAPFLPK